MSVMALRLFEIQNAAITQMGMSCFESFGVSTVNANVYFAANSNLSKHPKSIMSLFQIDLPVVMHSNLRPICFSLLFSSIVESDDNVTANIFAENHFGICLIKSFNPPQSAYGFSISK